MSAKVTLVLTLYYRADCPYALRVRLALAEKRLPFSRRVVGPGDAPAERNDLVCTEIPALVDGSFAVSHSPIIVEYLEDAFPRPALRPADARGRALVRAAMNRIDLDLMRLVEPADGGGSPRPGFERGFELALEPWDQRVSESGVLLGMELSLVDVWLLATIEKSALHAFAPPPRMVRLSAWLARMRERETLRAERLSPH